MYILAAVFNRRKILVSFCISLLTDLRFLECWPRDEYLNLHNHTAVDIVTYHMWICMGIFTRTSAWDIKSTRFSAQVRSLELNSIQVCWKFPLLKWHIANNIFRDVYFHDAMNILYHFMLYGRCISWVCGVYTFDLMNVTFWVAYNRITLLFPASVCWLGRRQPLLAVSSTGTSKT